MHRRMLAALTGAALLLLGTGCALVDPFLPGSSPDATASSASTSSPTGDGSSPAAATSSSAPSSSASAPSSSPSDASTPSPSTATATVTTMVWPDETWTVEEPYAADDYDPCAGQSAPAINAFSIEYFSCGPLGASLFNCRILKDDMVLCPTDYETRHAVRFRSPTAKDAPQQGNTNPSPFAVILEDGTTCRPINHDHAQHYAMRGGWLYCEAVDGYLLVDEETGDWYTDIRDDVHIVDLGIGTDPPTPTAVREIIYVGQDGDAGAPE